jgi:hypothetical protein
MAQTPLVHAMGDLRRSADRLVDEGAYALIRLIFT